MKFTNIYYLLPIIVTVMAAAMPDANPEPEADPGTRVTGDISAREAEPGPNELLDKRACIYNGCRCRVGTAPGVYCGWCYAVTAAGSGGAWSDVYQCASNGNCCRYGPRASCVNPANYSPCG
ncbi:hypothetical protein ABW19_dt0205427 [Dactylella cylindrospora]|nr:hypothetical protein ABW19_dt0205427 [Dactylella cylindrospora]